MATKKRMIDANKFKRKMKLEFLDRRNKFISMNDLLECIDDMPTLDAVEVVRCKDCKHYDNSGGLEWCNLNSGFYTDGIDWHSFPEYGYCSYGERCNNE